MAIHSNELGVGIQSIYWNPKPLCQEKILLINVHTETRSSRNSKIIFLPHLHTIWIMNLIDPHMNKKIILFFYHLLINDFFSVFFYCISVLGFLCIKILIQVTNSLYWCAKAFCVQFFLGHIFWLFSLCRLWICFAFKHCDTPTMFIECIFQHFVILWDKGLMCNCLYIFFLGVFL